MAEQLAAGNAALTLLANTLATSAILIVVISALGPVSGAHLNPAVSAVFALRGELTARLCCLYAGSQLVGATAGVIVAHAMFDQSLIQHSSTVRAGAGQWLAESVATFGLVGTILCTAKFRRSRVPYAVGLYIAAAYWFTSSTSFANPAVTVARSLSDTFAGIRAVDAPAFIVAEFVGAFAGFLFFGWLLVDLEGSHLETR